MKFFSFNKKEKKPKILSIVKEEKAPYVENYSNLIEVAKIISNSDIQVIEDMTLLVEDFESFLNKHNEWCVNMNFDLNYREETILNIFAYWLCGYDTEFVYGAYVDWKEETDIIIFLLQEVVKKLKYPISFDDFSINYDLDTCETLTQINQFLKNQNYTLFFLDTNSDCYHLFITNLNGFDKIDKLSDDIGFKFSRL